MWSSRCPSGSGRARWRGVAVAAAFLLATAACSQGPKAATSDRRAAAAPASGSSAPSSATSVTFAPDNGAAGATVKDPVVVNATNATLESVSVVSSGGKQVMGELSADRRRWASGEPLAYGETYTATATATDAAGRRFTQISRFTTVKPANLTMPSLRANKHLGLNARSTYGVGQPIVVHFDEAIADRAAAERALRVTTDPQVEGAWHWYADREVHYRPNTKDYWTPGTKVTVKAGVYGVDLGGGLYGQQDVTASFTIGDKRVAIADDNTNHIRVYINDKLARTVPTSMGKHETVKGIHGQPLDLRTRSGVHVVLGTERSTRMTGASWGLGPNSYDKRVNYTTHLSYQGEYLHEAYWNTELHGKQNDSHGCLNLGTEDAKWFMNNFIPGDVVEVRNTGIELDNMDGLTDWNMSWAEWVKGSALVSG
jgi:lipoprotein-anchoring transpeptidase ErfK/SrfK